MTEFQLESQWSIWSSPLSRKLIRLFVLTCKVFPVRKSKQSLEENTFQDVEQDVLILFNIDTCLHTCHGMITSEISQDDLTEILIV